MPRTHRVTQERIALTALIRLTERYIKFMNNELSRLDEKLGDYAIVGERQNEAIAAIPPIKETKERYAKLLLRFKMSRAKGTTVVDVPTNLLFILQNHNKKVL